MEKNLVDERVYLNGDSDALDYFESRRQSLIMTKILENASFGETIKTYDKFVDEIVELLKKLNFSDSIEYSVALYYLIKNGFLSKQGYFCNCESKNEIQKRLGINIVTGKGCCRNLSAIHKDVLERLKLYVKSFYCVSGVDMRIARTIEANHVLNLVEYNDTLYGIDLGNNCALFKFVDPFILEHISFYSDTKLRYKPYYEIINNESRFEDFVDTIKMFKNEIKKRHLSPLEYGDTIVPDVNQKMQDNLDIIAKFRNDTYPLRFDICEGMYEKKHEIEPKMELTKKF